MRIDQMTWLEVEDYLSHSNGVLIATGSIEQHGPIGLIGTDSICADSIATQVANTCAALVAPPICYTPAPFNTSFPGTISIDAKLFTDLLSEVFSGLIAQGFEKIYVVNGHGANLDPLATVADRLPAGVIRVRSWWSFDEVQRLRESLYGDWEGMHATPSEIAITQHVTGITHQGAVAPPEKLSREYIQSHAGDRHGPPQEHRAKFPDGRVGSHSALACAKHGEQLFRAAVASMTQDYQAFVRA